MEGFVNQYITLSCRLDDGTTTAYPQVRVYNRDGTLVTTKNLTHVGEGYYKDFTWAPPSSGHFINNYSIYTDVGRTLLDSNYNLCTEHIFITNEIALSSQVLGVSSQIHGTTFTATADLTPILEELDFISSQAFWASSQFIGISGMIFNTPPGAGATAAQVWAFASRELTINPEVSHISSQMQYISSQITHISSNVEMYGGGGGSSAPKSYVAYTSKQSPWKYREKERDRKSVV